MSNDRPLAVVTGASAGIGAATALRLAREGFDVVLGARRVERLADVAQRCGGRPLPLDVTDARSVEEFASALDRVDVLVNNAGLASGLAPLEETTDEQARVMFDTNVLGLIAVTRALLPKVRESSRGHVVNVGSISGFEVYPGGAGYTASKHAVRAITRTLRLELLGTPVRVTEVQPGMVETEFSLVRFEGDEGRASKVYEGVTPLTADDIADCIAWAVTRPPHVDVDEIVVRPVQQATTRDIARRDG
ncbi:MAG TPA: SDR family NAD(P)-dependent oxidoreductase [Actinomycetota bacterium]|nr:SDR family NAD(P)-dependent oxidoreductase [Actinomycetota bacterium]